ncbi:MAG: YidC/Oxa1 family insertase periplasmic-domain containing protein [Planctomycetaceae bacterium]
MDQNKRLILFFLVSGLVWFSWFGVIQPRFFPRPQQNAPVANDKADDVQDVADVDQAAGDDEAKEAVAEQEPAANLTRPTNEERSVTIGSGDPASGYFQAVQLDSRGATVAWVALNDVRYKELTDRKKPLQVVGDTDEPAHATFATHVAAVDEQLAAFKTDTTRAHWKVEKVLKDEAGVDSGVVFTLKAPDGSVELFKKYAVRRVEDSDSLRKRDTNPDGYMLDVEVGFRNLTDQPQSFAYTLQGPEGLPLENQAHTSKYRDLELGFLDEDGDLNAASLAVGDVTEMAEAAAAAQEAAERAAAADRRLVAKQKTIDDLEAQLKATPDDAALKTRLADETAELAAIEAEARERTDAAQEASRGIERWKTPFRYLGVEVQYFTALLFPQDSRPVAEQFKDPWIASGEPIVVEEGPKTEFNDISFTFTSTPLVVPPGGEASHEWELYAGPKRKELLSPLGADGVLDLGWFAIVSQGMLWILEKLHAFGIPYGIAIICLTIIVRGALFPLSRKQAIGAAKMKDLQPKLAELKTKYGSDQEKFLRAQMELFKKHGYGPLGPMASGCLPIFLQLPIFIGLYNALQNSVDLRMAEFLWIDNLAAPDQLWVMPFSIWYLGSDFNLLPFITVVLFYIQQKLFMPPATTPEQEAQYKMMNFMMLFMGVFFYHVPAGLCIYFIASSLWSIGERTLLGKTKAGHIGAAEAAEIEHEIEEIEHEKKPSAKGKAGRSGSPSAPRAASDQKQPTWLERLFNAAEQARKQAELGGDKTRPSGPKPKTRPRR